MEGHWRNDGFVISELCQDESLAFRGASLDQQDISILDQIIFAFRHDLALCFNLALITVLLQCIIIIHDDLDERFLKV